jgi:FkbM family methyltransferase
LHRLAPGQPQLALPEWAGCQFSFSQLGEDRVLVHLLGDIRDPARMVYVDVGAHDPVVFSNTFLLHKRGWRGVNIDASADGIERFRSHRPLDRNVCAAVSDSCREVVYYHYPSPAANRIGPPGEDGPNILGERPVAATPMVTRPLNEVLAEQLRPGEQVGLLNIDCEGEDLALLRHLDWRRWQPEVVAVESHTQRTTYEMVRAMTAQGYTLVGQMLVTLVFRRAKGEPSCE